MTYNGFDDDVRDTALIPGNWADPKSLRKAEIGSCEKHYFAEDKALYSLWKTMVEMNRFEDFICIFSTTALGAFYERIPRYKCCIGCG